MGVGGMKDRANFKGYVQGSGLGYFAVLLYVRQELKKEI